LSLGGGCTDFAGLVAKRYGPSIGGLFLVFPAIFPSGASLIENHEKRRKVKSGVDGTLGAGSQLALPPPEQRLDALLSQPSH